MGGHNYYSGSLQFLGYYTKIVDFNFVIKINIIVGLYKISIFHLNI